MWNSKNAGIILPSRGTPERPSLPPCVVGCIATGKGKKYPEFDMLLPRNR
jgi:hypothetical protein